MIVEYHIKAPLIGDSLSTLPFILETLPEGAQAYITGEFSNLVKPLCANFPIVFHLPPGKPHKSYTLHPSEGWHRVLEDGQSYHASYAYFKLNNLPAPSSFPLLNLAETTNKIPQGVTIAPFSRSDEYNLKCWPVENWISVIDALKKTHPIYVLGGPEDDTVPYENAGAIALKGKPLAEVLSIMRQSKVNISIDTGLSHLATFAHLSNHILLYPNTLLRNFAENPFSAIVRASSIQQLAVDQVVKEVEKKL